MKHVMEEVLVCIIMGFLHGKVKLRRIHRWAKDHLDELRVYMDFPNGVPSVPTMSRVLAAVDEELLSLAIINWVGETVQTRGVHIAIDGKALRAAANKIMDQKTPYIVNAIEVATKMVIGQLAIAEKTNEMTAIPKLLEFLEVSDSVITIDAIGATGNIMNAVISRGAGFMLQVKRNCPELYDEIQRLFDGLETDKKDDPDLFSEKYGKKYSKKESEEKNRERMEYRKCEAYYDPDGLGGIQEKRPYVQSIGRTTQLRILRVLDENGNDVTPSRKEFLKTGSRKQPKPTKGDGFNDDLQKTGLIASHKMDAEEMMKYKRDHWRIENSLHYILDETFGEDKSTIRKGRNVASMLRKTAYNIVRLLQHIEPERSPLVPEIIDDISANFSLGARMIFEAIPSFY